MLDRKEWIGRAINVACRLQSAIEDIDFLMGYSVMISNNLFQSMKYKLESFQLEIVKRRLKNFIRGVEIPCCRLSISEIPFKIIFDEKFTTKMPIIKFEF